MGTSDKFNIIFSKEAYKYLQKLPQNIRLSFFSQNYKTTWEVRRFLQIQRR